MDTLIESRKAKWNSMIKRSISEATISVFREYGFDGLNMKRVATTAEVASGTLYNYFKNKDELLLHVVDMKFESIHQELLRIQNADISPPVKIEYIIKSLLTFIADERGLVIVVIDYGGLSLPVRNSVNAKREIAIRIIAEIIEEGIENGFFKKFDAIQVAKSIYGTIYAASQITIGKKDGLRTIEETVANILNLIFSGLYLTDKRSSKNESQ